MENKERREIFFKFSLFIFHLFSKFFTLPDRKRAFEVVRLKPLDDPCGYHGKSPLCDSFRLFWSLFKTPGILAEVFYFTTLAMVSAV
jgi:hypothetical protein